MTAERVNLTFRGLNLNAAAPARMAEADGDTQSPFVEHETPLPVGSRLTVRSADGTGGDKEARVVAVVEQEGGSKAVPGMKIAWVEAVVAPVIAAPVIVEPFVAEPLAVTTAAPEGGEGEGEPAGEAQEETAGPTATGDTGGGKRGKRKNRRTLK